MSVLSGFPFRRFLVLLVPVLAAMGAHRAAAEMPHDLEGTWTMSDETPALLHASNPETFTVSRVIPGQTEWADGYFFLRWPGAVSPERGYYSLKTGRVWFTTYRWVNDKQARVEYRGTVKSDGSVVWSGTGSTLGATKETWEFVATRQ